MLIERLHYRAISMLIALLLVCPLILAQAPSNASLDVLVRDPSGALIGKAQVQLTSTNKSPLGAQTNQKGEARFNRLSAGTYQLHVEAVGFKSYDLDALILNAGANRTEVTLEIEVIKADVDVTEEEVVKNTNPPSSARVL